MALLATPCQDADRRMSEKTRFIQLPTHRVELALRSVEVQAELCERLRAAVAEAASRDASAMAALRVAVSSFTVALRSEGLTPEAVLIILKTVINNRSFLHIAPHASDWSGDQLRESISTWCIKEFFKEKSA